MGVDGGAFAAVFILDFVAGFLEVGGITSSVAAWSWV